MKRQAEGVSCLSKEGPEQPATNGSKRIKLLNTDESGGSLVDIPVGGKPVPTISFNESSHKQNQKDHSPSVSENNNTTEELIVTTLKSDENHSCQNMKANQENNNLENGNFNHMENNYNGSCKTVISLSISDTGIISDGQHSNSQENSVIVENEDVQDLVPPVLNHCDHDIQNSESTDSFQSEGFEADNCTRESHSEVSEKHPSQEQNNDHEKECPVELGVKTIDVDNLMLSHLNVIELEGHTDVVFSVAADEDYVLSASADTTVRVWNTEHKSNVSTFSGHSDCVTSVLLLNPNQSKTLKKKMSLTKVSRIAITGSLDCNIKLWSVLEGKELASVYTYNGITCLGYLESECLVVVGTEGGKLELWDMASLEAKKSERAHEDAVTDIKVKDNYIYSTSTDGTVKVWVYEDDDIYPLYTRKRKEISSDKGFKPAHWNSLTVFEGVIYLGDSTNNIKVLDWKAGHLRLFKNQTENSAICECVEIEKNMLFSTCYDSSSDVGGVNVWKLPEMAYVCSLTNAISRIKSLAVIEKDNKLQIVSGGDKLCIWEFDFSRPPSPENECNAREVELIGCEIDENPVEVKNRIASNFSPGPNSPNNRWCSIM